MRSIRQAIEETLAHDPLLRHGLATGVLALRRAAAQLKDTIESRTKKEVTIEAIAMALSRLQREKRAAPTSAAELRNLELEYVALHRGLAALTFAATEQAREKLKQLINLLQRHKRFFTLTQSSNEITVVIDRELRADVIKTLSKRPIFSTDHVAAIGVKFHERFLHQPGFLSAILRELALQGIDVIELASTATELTVYVTESEATRATDALLWRFSPELKRRKRPRKQTES